MATLGRVEDRLLAVEAQLAEALTKLDAVLEYAKRAAVESETGERLAVVPPHWTQSYPPELESTGMGGTVVESYRRD